MPQHKTKTSFKKGHGGVAWLGRKPTAEHIAKIKDAKKKNPYRHSDEIKNILADLARGAKNPHWRGGVTEENRVRFNDLNWRKKAQEARIRDNFTCQNCGKKPSISVHHIVPWRISKDDRLTNLITLCPSCHMKIERALKLK